jgi:hypothetical protein
MIHDLKVDLSRSKMSSLQENQIRKIHYVAKERLRGFIKVIFSCLLTTVNNLKKKIITIGYSSVHTRGI